MSTAVSSPRAGFILLIALLATLAGGKAILFDTLDPDCFWHLKVAETLQSQGIGPIVDDLSFSSVKEPWTPYSWLAELAMKGIWDAGGFRLAIAVQAMLQAGFIVFIALASRELCGQGRSLSIGIACAFAGYLSLPFLSFRPVTMVLVLLALGTWLMLRDRRLNERSKAIVWLVPITLIATNMHLFAFFIPIWIVMMMTGSALERNPRSSRRYGLLLVVCALASVGTPMLNGMMHSIVFYSWRDAMVASPVISEMQGILTGNYFNLVLLLALFACIIGKRKSIRAGEILWLIFSTALLLKLGRFAPIFAIIAAPLLTATMPALSDELLSRRPVIATLWVVLVLIVGRLVVDFPSSSVPMSAWLNRHGPDAPGYPTAAADYVDARVAPQSRRLINEFTWGGYLEWRLNGRFLTLLDGRTQVFPAQLWKATYLGNDSDRQELVKQTGADAALIPAGKSLFRSALQSQGWQSVYKDDRAEVLLPPGASIADLSN